MPPDPTRYSDTLGTLRQFNGLWTRADGRERYAASMRTVSVVLLSLPLTACPLATINDANVIKRSESQIKVLVVTDKPLSDLDGSWCIDHIYLRYRIDPAVVTRNLDTKAEEWKFPFDATERNYVSCPTGTAGHCSEWSIQLAAETSINNISYEYRLAEKSAIQLQLGGGNMLGCVRRSNVYTVIYTQ